MSSHPEPASCEQHDPCPQCEKAAQLDEAVVTGDGSEENPWVVDPAMLDYTAGHAFLLVEDR